ncbi:MAG: hypothetical protein ACK53Y_06780, partial [bacterium]
YGDGANSISAICELKPRPVFEFSIYSSNCNNCFYIFFAVNAPGMHLVDGIVLVSKITEISSATGSCLPLAGRICNLYASSQENYQYNANFNKKGTSNKLTNFSRW